MDFNKLTRKQSGLVILLVYLSTIIIGTIGIFVGVALWIPPFWLFLFIDIVMTCLIFIAGLVVKNASFYDPYWSVIPPYLIVVYSLIYGGAIFTLRFLPLLLVIVFWSVRLTYNWWKNWTGFAVQDWRYDLLKAKNERLYPITNLFGIHLVPTIVVYLQVWVIFKMILNMQVNAFFIVGLLISLSGPIIQVIADKQMYDFRQTNITKKTVMNSGLWRFSRHPNYLGELLFWIGFYVIYLGANGIDFLVLCPIAMVLLFVFISIPMMENKLKHRPGYAEYKAKVPKLIPITFRRNKKTF